MGMSERPGPAGSADLPHHLLNTGVPVALTRTSFGVAASVTGPCGTALLTVTQRAEPPEEGDPPALLVIAAGEIDLYTAPLLEAALNDAVYRHTTVRCDLSDVRILSAAGITALISAHQRATETGSELTVHGAHGLTRRVLQVTGVERLLCEPWEHE
jgi:anti-anti-sigma factor